MLETKTANIYIKDEIVHLVYKKGANVSLEAIEENLKAKIAIQKGKAMKTLVDVRAVWQYSDEAREVVSSKRFQKITIAMAVVVVGYSLAIKMIANFFMRINKPVTPTKLFKKEANAIEWLKNYS